MVHLARFAAPDRVGQSPAFIDGHGGEIDPIGHVSHGVDVGHVGALFGIHGDAMALDRHTGCFQIQALKERSPAGGQQHAVAGQPLMTL